MNKIVTLAVSLILSFGALFSQKIDYDNSSKWYLGFNFGGTWQTTDVANRTGGGWGLTLGKSFNYNYGRRLTFDIRGRYLGGNWYGQDLKVTDSAGYTGAPLKPYMDSLGFAVHNFQTELHSLSLELVLHANGVRERSGWDPYIFGGVGVKWYQTYGDLYFNDSLGGIYDYDPSMLSKGYISSLTDGVYDTPLEGATKDKFTVGLMPSLGFGIGYQVGKRVTLGLEHKTTFTLTDDFDGYTADSKYKQDIYHYTSAFINFRFRKGGRGGGGSTGGGVGNVDNYNNNTNNLTGCNPPVVTYIQPSSVGMTVNSMSYVVIADVKEVVGKENISFKHNGVNTLNFTYNPTTDRLEAQVILTPGSNTFEIYATNTCGSDTEGLNVNYQNCVAPVISLVSPSGTSTSVSNATFAFSAFVTNVDNPQGLTMTVNNRSVTNYSMNSTTGSLQATLNLIPGVNTVVVTATNACGTVSETITINYQNCAPPVITVLNPATSGTTVNSSIYTFNASVQNVTSSQGITLKLNNAFVPNLSFNATSGVVQNNVTLQPGLNTFIITATNSCGNDSETVTINYTRELNNTGGNNGGNTGGGNNGGGNQEQKITICHYPPGNNNNPQTIEIPLSAWPAHQAHGDKLGPCPEVNNNNGGNGNNGGGNEKITICHYPPGNNGNPQTIEIPLSAWPAHQAHGDKLGPCDNSGTGNGNSGGNGNNGNNGNGNGNANNGGGNEKITICHYPPGNNGNPQTIEIPLSAWPAHQAHGDKLGPCDNSGTGNGNNGGNGNNIDNGNSGGNGNNGGNEKITICHYPPGNNGNPQTIDIPLSAWPAHQAHGDKLGPCDDSGTGNGNNGGNGNGNGNNGNSNGNSGNGNSGNGSGNSNNNGGNQGFGNTNGNGNNSGNVGNGGNNGNGGSGSNNGGGNGNNGHGNNADGIDSSNPGQGNGGPNGGADGSGDDENGNGNTGNGGSNGTSQNGNQGTSNGNSGSGSGNGSNGSTENGSNGSSNGGNTSNGNGSGQGSTDNGSGSGNGANGSNNGSGSTGNGGNNGDGGDGGGSNKTKSTSTGTNKGNGTKPTVKPAGTKVTDQKPGTPKPADKNEAKPSETETKPEGGKTEPPAVKPSEIKPGTGGGKGGKQ